MRVGFNYPTQRKIAQEQIGGLSDSLPITTENL